MKNQQFPVPTEMIRRVKKSVEMQYAMLSQRHQQRVLRGAIEMWYYIYNRQMESEWSSNFRDHYVNIEASDLDNEFRFYLQYLGKRQTICYSDISELLVAAKCLECNDKYSVGAFTKSYRIPPALLNSPDSTNVEFDLKRIFGKKYREVPAELTALHVSSQAFTIDLDSYFRWIDANPGILLGIKPAKVKNKKWQPAREIRLDAHHARAFKMWAIRCYLDVTWWKLADTGRVYSTWTNLSKTALPFIRSKHNTEQLVEIDATNCQAALLVPHVESELFRLDAGAGILYERLALASGLTRDEIKLKWMHMMYAPEPVTKKEHALLESAYPGFADELNQLKTKTELWKILQSREAECFIAAAKHLPVCITRHDAIIVPQNYASLCDRLLMDRFKSINTQVKLKHKQLK